MDAFKLLAENGITTVINNKEIKIHFVLFTILGDKLGVNGVGDYYTNC